MAPPKRTTKGSIKTSVAGPEESIDDIKFTANEKYMFIVAWACIKGGVLDVDILKLAESKEFKGDEAAAAKLWAGIKEKLKDVLPASIEGGTGEISASTTEPEAESILEEHGKTVEVLTDNAEHHAGALPSTNSKTVDGDGQAEELVNATQAFEVTNEITG